MAQQEENKERKRMREENKNFPTPTKVGTKSL
jgi:hypothetical protein